MSFSGGIKRFNDKAIKKAEKVFRGTALDLYGRLVKRSPVGDPSLWMTKPPKGYTGGTFRANWQTSVNRPASGEIASTSTSTADAKARGATVTAKLGDSIYITNNLPYAQRIEDGWSYQRRPNAVVGLTVREFKRIVKAQARRS